MYAYIHIYILYYMYVYKYTILYMLRPASEILMWTRGASSAPTIGSSQRGV